MPRGKEARRTSPATALEPPDLAQMANMGAAVTPQDLPSFPEDKFTRLDEHHLRHDETGLVAHQNKSKIVDPTGKMYNKRLPSLCRALCGHTDIYHALKSEAVPGNWLSVADSAGIHSVVKITDMVLCPYCLLFCSSYHGVTAYRNHEFNAHGIQRSQSFQAKKPVKCRGCFFFGGVKQNTYFILTEVYLEDHASSIKEMFHYILKIQNDIMSSTVFPCVKPSARSRDPSAELEIRERVLKSVSKTPASKAPGCGIGSNIAEEDVLSTDEEEEEIMTPRAADCSYNNTSILLATMETDGALKLDLSDLIPCTSVRTFLEEKQVPRPSKAPSTSSIAPDRAPFITPFSVIVPKERKRTAEEILMNAMFDDVDCYTSEMVESLTPEFEKSMMKTNPALVKVVNDYLIDSSTSTNVLPFVLLNCITDDLPSETNGLSETFKLVLKAQGPEVVMIAPRGAFQFSLSLSLCQRDWSSCIGWTAEPDTKILQLTTTELSFFDICETLVTFRAMAITLCRYFGQGGKRPSLGMIENFIKGCLREHRCGEKNSALIVYERLFKHVCRWE